MLVMHVGHGSVAGLPASVPPNGSCGVDNVSTTTTKITSPSNFTLPFIPKLIIVEGHPGIDTNMEVRPATKAGSWYTDDPDELREELQEYLDQVPDSIDGKTLPIQGARVVISP